MKILTSQQTKEVEAATLSEQNISSWDLMERAATKLTERLMELFSEEELFFAVGRGGNGGDGLAMARMLSQKGYAVSVLTLFDDKKCSDECCKNLELLPSNIDTTSSVDRFMEWINESEGGVVIDAVLGTGSCLRPYSFDLRQFILSANKLDRERYSVVAIDVPSGMGSAFDDVNETTIIADHTLTIYAPKLPMLMADYGECVGELSIIDIGYSDNAIDSQSTNLYFTTNVSHLIPKRKKFAHKGNFGSLLIIGGGMFGASIIAARGAEAVGCGIVTVFANRSYETALYSNIPSAILLPNNDLSFTKAPDNIEKYSAVCVGMGINKEASTVLALSELFLKCNAELVPMLIDAGALNLLSENVALRNLIPEGSILTPHIGEFRRLVGEWRSESEKLDKLLELSRDSNCTVILKGAYSAIATPEGDIYFNSNGNPAMARAASGDMLAGIASALLARGLSPSNAAIAAVFLHAEAADKARAMYGENYVTIDRWLSSF